MIGFIVGFLVIASLWYAYHCNMKYVKRVDGKFVGLNVLFVFFIAFLPFPTAILGRYPGHFGSVLLYAVAMILVCIMSALMWMYATRDDSLIDDLTENRAKAIKMRPIFNIAWFILSIPPAFIRPFLTMAAWGLAIMGNDLLTKKLYKVYAYAILLFFTFCFYQFTKYFVLQSYLYHHFHYRV